MFPKPPLYKPVLAPVVNFVRALAKFIGTTAYMAPEQLEGREVSVQSDIYALGFIFYEMFTGMPAHRADSVAESLELRRGSDSVTNPSQLVTDIDPAVERAILRCLQADPKLRPASARRWLPSFTPAVRKTLPCDSARLGANTSYYLPVTCSSTSM